MKRYLVDDASRWPRFAIGLTVEDFLQSAVDAEKDGQELIDLPSVWAVDLIAATKAALETFCPAHPLPTTILLFDTEDKTFHRMRRTAWEEDLKGELDDAPRGHWDD
jgi:hypothetical protein